MGALDQRRFDELVRAGCPACGGRLLAIDSYIDRSLDMMAGEPNNEGRWVHTGEKFFAAPAAVRCTARGLRPRRRFASGGLAQTRAGSRLRRVPRGSST